MKLTEFTFHFVNGQIKVLALNKEQAKILAQAEAINRGWDHRIMLPRISHIDIHVDWSRLDPEEEKTLYKLLMKAQTNAIFEKEEEN